MTVDLLGFDNVGRRGIDDPVDDVPDLSIGVVIGVGGGGIQTVSRVRSAIQAQRPDASAAPSIEFLGVDAVDLGKQNPPLPAGVTLGPRQMYNLTENVFDASEYIRLVGGGSSALGEWWDHSFRPPIGPLIDGLKQSRMLGRLAFYRESGTLAAKIEQALSRSVQIHREHLVEGIAAEGAQGVAPKVFVVGSSCGGTGSAGLLEVLHKIWVAARRLGQTPEIRVFTYLPGVFQDEILNTSTNPALEMANVQANAFAFLREFDHFINHSDELHRNVSNPPATLDPRIPAGELVKQVYAVDATIGGAGRLSRITDAYEIVAEAIYQLLMTDAGRPQIAANGTNTDVYLRAVDAHGKRRIYCGIGIASVTYPGDTYRRHLVHRFADSLIRNHLVPRPADLQNVVYKDPGATTLIDEVQALHNRVASAELPPDTLEFQVLAETAPEVLADNYSEAVVVRVYTAFVNTSPRAVADMQARLRIARDQALGDLDPTVIDAFLRTGQGIPFGIEMIKNAERAIGRLREEVAEVRATNQNAAPRLQKETDELRRKLRGLTERRFVMPGSREKAAEELGRSIQAWGAAIIGEHKAEGEVRYLDAARTRLVALRSELEAAESRLLHQAEGFYRAWRSDELVGKDAGPVDTTVLVPSDAQPEIEDSKLAEQAFNAVLAALNSLNLIEVVRDMYDRWRRVGAGRAAFGLGSDNPDERKRAEDAFLTEVTTLASIHVLQVGAVAGEADPDALPTRLILPRTLADAGDRADGGSSLLHGLQSLVALSQKACWQWDAARLGDIQDGPAPATVIVRPKSLADHVARYFTTGAGLSVIDGDDEERVVAMTTEWGVSAHAIAPVNTWYTAYERALMSLGNDASRPRPHLDRGWSSSITGLVPTYFDRGVALDTIAKALLGDALLKDDATAKVVFGPHLRSRNHSSTLSTEDHGDRVDFIGTIFTDDPTNAAWLGSRSINLGSTYALLVAEVGASAEYRQSTKGIADAIVRAAGRTKAIAALEDLLAKRYRPLNERGNRNHEVAEAVDDICAALAELQENYRQAELMAGQVALD